MSENLAEEFFSNLTSSNFQALLTNPLLQKENWQTVEDLGLRINEHNKVLSLHFQGIQQEWLKSLVKLYILIRSRRGLSAMYLRNEILYLSKFSDFLCRNPRYDSNQINIQTFEEFEHYLKSLDTSKRSIALNYVTLKIFFDVCRLEGWLDVSTYWFDGKRRGSPRFRAEKVEYIPEEVWEQLDRQLHYLPEMYQRMVLIIRTMGLRIGELLNLPLNCLRLRNEQWRLRFTTEKYGVEDELPIQPELVAIIQEQQKYIRQHFGDSFNKLFCSNGTGGVARREFVPTPKVMKIDTFNRRLNLLAKQRNICTKDGELWHFRSHQFRKTVATVMTNAGVRDLIIQKYLRHRSPEMQDYYKHLLKQVLANEYEQLLKEKKYVDISGKVVASYKPNNAITELMRRKMHQLTTQYGECHRPTLKEPCKTVNACWGCEHWRTSLDDLHYLKDDFLRVDEELKIAESLGMIRQKQGLETDLDRLATRIKSLEKLND